MLAVQFVRGFTGRDMLAKFEGSYHGTYDDVSWSVGTGSREFGPPDKPIPIAGSMGMPQDPSRVLVLPFNDLSATTRLIEENAGRLAALFVEPVANRLGLILPKPGFLEGLRRLCDEHGIVLIFDEVISFRVGYHGAQGMFGVTPDLTTLGKIIGGGYPIGAVLGRADVMAISDITREERVPHFGTFAANPVSLIAGKTAMEALTPEAFEALAARGEKVRSELERICKGLPLQVTGVGSLFKVNATPQEIVDYRTAVTVDRTWQEVASLELLCEGYYLTTKLHGCVSTATTEEEINGFLNAFEKIVRGG
jgi:glutamate-1-semialdehyde 2,1-aminomutase